MRFFAGAQNDKKRVVRMTKKGAQNDKKTTNCNLNGVKDLS